MLKVLILFCSVFSTGFAFAGQVDSDDLRAALRNCRDVEKPLRCLRRSVRQLIRQSERGGSSSSNLICRSGSNGKFAVYDNDNNRFLDPNYGKTAIQCKETINTSFDGLICVTNGNSNGYAVRRIDNLDYLSPNFSISHNECVRSLDMATERYICIAGSNSKYARYDRQTGNYLDSNYSMALGSCLAVLP